MTDNLLPRVTRLPAEGLVDVDNTVARESLLPAVRNYNCIMAVVKDNS